MRRTILGLFDEPPENPIESRVNDSGTVSIQVEERQETLGGVEVVIGEAATIKQEDVSGIGIDSQTGEIRETVRTEERCIHVEFFAVPNPPQGQGFVAVDAGAGTDLFHALWSMTGSRVREAKYDLDEFGGYLEELHADFWAVGWSSGDEAGSWFPGPNSDEDITAKGLRERKNQLGFECMRRGEFFHGTVAASGYLELYEPSHWDALGMARFLLEDARQFAYLPDEDEQARALDEAERQAREESADCESCGRTTDDAETVDGQTLCVVCADKEDEQTTLDESTTDEGEDEEEPYAGLDSVNVTDGGQ